MKTSVRAAGRIGRRCNDACKENPSLISTPYIYSNYVNICALGFLDQERPAWLFCHLIQTRFAKQCRTHFFWSFIPACPSTDCQSVSLAIFSIPNTFCMYYARHILDAIFSKCRTIDVVMRPFHSWKLCQNVWRKLPHEVQFSRDKCIKLHRPSCHAFAAGLFGT